MSKRVIPLFAVFVLCGAYLIYVMLCEALTQEYVETVNSQARCTVTVCSTRGAIYDRMLRPLAGCMSEYRAVVVPSNETAENLAKIFPQGKIDEISDRLTGRTPFVVSVSDACSAGNGVDIFSVPVRYGKRTLAPHILGYVNCDGKGVSGAERVFDEYLSSCSGSMKATYTVDAVGRKLSGVKPQIFDSTPQSNAGVALTLDADIQMIAEDAAKQCLGKGAILVSEVSSGDILACVSTPGFDPSDVAASLESVDSPFVNRAFSDYDVGSVFKLVVAAAALESGISPETSFECTGSVDVGGVTFNCSSHTGHGLVNMEQATAFSCNSYFIQLAMQLGGEPILDFAQKLGFSKCIELFENWQTDAGILPEKSMMRNPAALANLSFGQGKLMLTPLHIAGFIGAAANGGVMNEPVIAAGLADRGRNISPFERKDGTRVMSEETAAYLRKFMRACMEYGTGKNVAVERAQCAAKTGSAETGMERGGHEVTQAWFAGFFPYDEPKYVCVVLAEDGVSGAASAGPAFAYIADRLSV